MAVLTDEIHLKIWRGLMRYWSNSRTPVPIVKADLRAAINAADNWADDNAAEYNNALPPPAKTVLSAEQKAAILATVILARFNPALLRDILGEVD